MDTFRGRRCQIAGALLLLLMPGSAGADALAGWQKDLNAARALALAAALNAPAPDGQKVVEKTFRDLSAKYPENAEVQAACGDFFWSASESQEAMKDWQRAQALAPGDGAVADALGGGFLRDGDIEKAAAQFERAVNDDPGDAQYHFDLANVLSLFRNQFASDAAGRESCLIRALGEYRRAAELAPADRRFVQTYAESFYTLAKPDWNAALAAWLAVRKSDPNSASFVNSHLARISLKLRRTDDAIAYLGQIDDPAFDALKQKLRAQADAQRNSISTPSK